MALFARSITFNDLTATISFPRKLNSDNQINWTVALTSGTNKTSTTGIVTMELPDPTPKLDMPEPTPVPITDDRAKCITTIKNLLADIDATNGKDNKAPIVIKLLDYICGPALDFTKINDKFNDTVIKKCYQFKVMNADMPKLVEKANETLTKLGASTTISTDFTVDCCKLCEIKYNTSVAPVASVAPAAAAKPVEKKEAYNPDMALFIALANKYNAKAAINNPKIYFSYYENLAKWTTIKGSTKAEKMIDYFSKWTDNAKRENLMRSLFTKNNLVFSDAVMTLYYEWVKTYVPTGKTNRYIKMCVFIDENKSLFTAN